MRLGDPMINWNQANNYDALLNQAAELNKPIFLDLYAEENAGCEKIDKTIYQNPHIAELINHYTLPLRVVTSYPDAISTRIINNHIYIWSPTIQLLAADGTRYHEWYGAPRQTRHSVGYLKTHHEVDGDLNEERFLAQLYIALGKASLRQNNFREACQYFEKVTNESNNHDIALKEANYWLKIAENKGKIIHTSATEPHLNFLPLSNAIEELIKKTSTLSDSLLMQDWQGMPGKGDWRWYTDCLREFVLQTYQKLCDLNHVVRKARAIKNKKLTSAQEILADFHVSYREFQAALLNVQDAHLDLTPFPRERSLRENIVHCILSEWWAHSPQIRFAVSQSRQMQQAELMPAHHVLAKYGEPIGTFETLGELLSRYELLHCHLLNEFSDISDAELEAPSKWWEGEPVTIGFRLKRLGWHLRDHRVTLENILQEVGHKRTQVERFCQLIMLGLAHAETAFIGTDATFLEDKQNELLEFVLSKTKEIEQLA